MKLLKYTIQSVCLVERGNHHLVCGLFLRLLPDGREDLSGGAGGAPDLRLRGSHQWPWWGSGTVSRLVHSLHRKG